ncbi:hypothetical protein C0J52_23928 [Blattella germanica]|nr:hypothetical protein C0J52_23928 [Blattella germanica]
MSLVKPPDDSECICGNSQGLSILQSVCNENGQDAVCFKSDGVQDQGCMGEKIGGPRSLGPIHQFTEEGSKNYNKQCIH